MSNPIGPADLTKFQSGLKFSDLHNWRHIPASAVVQLTPQMKAELAASEAREKQQKIDFDAETASNPDFYSPKSESNQMIRTNVAELDVAGVQMEIDVVTKLIQSGESETRDFHGGNGDEGTTSIHKYLYWLQQRAQQLDGDGTYTPSMFG